MSIELLWIIPIVAVALLVLVLILNLQQNKDEYWENTGTKDLNREVAEFNNGIQDVNIIKTETQETRLRDMENTIKIVSTALSSQQKIIENFHGGDKKIGDELNNLKHKLHEIQQEYDTIISENYTLRARLKKIEQNKETSYLEINNKKDSSDVSIDRKESNKVLDVKIYDKPRKIKSSKSSYLEDTAELSVVGDNSNKKADPKNEESKRLLDKNSKGEKREKKLVTEEEELNNNETLHYNDTKKLIINESILDNSPNKNHKTDDTSQEKKSLNKLSDIYHS
jgi:hypothetical protein